MNFERFIKNIADQIIEAQIKLGYVKESVMLYYPLESLGEILECEQNSVIDSLNSYFENNESVIGKISLKKLDGRIQILVPAEGVEYVHKNCKPTEFLVELIEMFSKNHHLDIQQICELFGRFSNNYHCEKMSEDTDFDYVLYFDDSSVDEYYYCIKMEMGHTIYHRFTKYDYLQML